MQRIVRQVCGIDVAKDELVVAAGRLYDDMTPELFARKTFPNSDKGLSSLLEWMSKLTDPSIETRYVMEATGVYHEKLAYFLHAQGQAITVVLPNKISN